MNWYRQEIDVKGDVDFLKELEAIIDKHNPATDSAWLITGHIADILQDLHLNIKPYKDLRVYWTKALLNNKNHLVISQLLIGFSTKNHMRHADVLIKAFPDKISGINYGPMD